MITQIDLVKELAIIVQYAKREEIKLFYHNNHINIKSRKDEIILAHKSTDH